MAKILNFKPVLRFEERVLRGFEVRTETANRREGQNTTYLDISIFDIFPFQNNFLGF